MDIHHVTSRETFLQFLAALHAEHQRAASTWENPTLERYLEALAAYAADADLPDVPTWRTFAQLLVVATIYE